MQRALLAIAAFAALAAPSVARAGDVSIRVRDVVLQPRSLAGATAPQHFNMLAVHWTGTGTVAYRTRALHGAWRPWRQADADSRSGAWHDGTLDWTGASGAVRFRTTGSVRRLRSYELWSRVSSVPPRALAQAGTPPVVTRAAWGADEEIVRARPSLAPAVRLAVIHHTAGTNAYTRAQSAAIVRGIEVYHVQANGWNDIGYNFLVDRFGTVYEGRGGGIDRNVIGAHAEGFNTGTTGVALLGNFTSATPTAAQQSALARLVAWRLDVAHVDPLSTVVYTSGGNAKFRAGKVVTLRAISGHRDTGPSECPGARAYALLPGLARRVASIGLPKLYSPTVIGTLGGPVRFQARLSSSLAWTVTIVDRLGKPVAKGTGRGDRVDWTWASAGTKGGYAWTIDAPGIRVATGTIGAVTPPPPPPASFSLTNLVASPSVITPNADGSGDTTTVSFTLGTAARMVAQVLDSGGAPLLTLLNETRPAGANTFVWGAHVLPDGRYRLAVTARAGGKVVTKAADVVVDRTLAGLHASLPVISPTGDGVNDTVTFSFALAQNVPLRLEILQDGFAVATPFQGQLGVGPHAIDWDGTANGVPLPDGAYVALVTVTDALGDVQLSLPLAIDTIPPVLTLLDARTLKFSLNEPATVTVVVNGKTRLVKNAPKGTFTVGYSGAVLGLTAVAQDAGGNVGPAISG
jgi:hypothetical protein